MSDIKVKMVTVKRLIDGKNGDIEISQEMILIESIVFLRPWHKSAKQVEQVKGDISMLGIRNRNRKGKAIRFLINESIDSFTKRLGPSLAIQPDESK